ncbi:MAG: 50S ribosomal protein L14e [Candidatus Thorarchaeota archaeon]
MAKLYETGRICVKTMGREVGSYCVIVEAKDENMVLITGPKHISGIRRRSCNIRHLEPLDTIIEIKSGADDKDIEKALESAGLLDKFRTKIRISE